MRKSGIYKIVNTANNKFYVGSAVDLNRRKVSHWWKLKRGDHRNKHLQSAWNKYGEAAFIFVVVEEIPNKSNLLSAENIWLKQHVGKDYCYNIAPDASAPTLGCFREKNPMWGKTFKHTPEAIEKIRQASIGRVLTEQTKALIRASRKGRTIPDEVRAKISIATSGVRNHNYGKPRTAKFLEKVSRPVAVTNREGVTEVYPSVTQVKVRLGMARSAVHMALKKRSPLVRGRFKGYLFEPLDDALD